MRNLRKNPSQEKGQEVTHGTHDQRKLDRVRQNMLHEDGVHRHQFHIILHPDVFGPLDGVEIGEAEEDRDYDGNHHKNEEEQPIGREEPSGMIHFSSHDPPRTAKDQCFRWSEPNNP